jgi:serine O-acetyltransferase
VQTLPRPIRFLFFPFYRMAFRWVRNHYGIILYYTTQVGRRVVFANQGNISIHYGAVIGDDCIIRQNVTIGGVKNARNEPPSIGNRVEIGAGAVIIGRIHIGDGVHIGPNAVVSQNLKSGAIAVAAPTRILYPTTVPENEENPESSDASAVFMNR